MGLSDHHPEIRIAIIIMTTDKTLDCVGSYSTVHILKIYLTKKLGLNVALATNGFFYVF